MTKTQSVFIHRHSGLQNASVAAPDSPVWRPIRGPFERWPHLTDFFIAMFSFALNLLMWGHEGAGDGLSMATLPDVGAYLCMFVGNFALLWRRSHPWQVHALILGLSVALFVAAPVDGVIAMTFSLYSLGRYEASQQASVVGVLAAFVFVVMDLVVINTPGAGSTFAATMVLALWYVGRRLRFRGEYLRLLEEKAKYLERERDAESERAVAAERSRIAREMHDIVAHKLSLMTVQAGAARTIVTSAPQAASEAMASVETAGRHALAEMRHLLGVLRPVDTADDLEPQPGIDQVSKLVEQVGKIGLSVCVQMAGDLSGLPAGIELAVYRIVQEALTNVIKHVGTHANVEVGIEGSRTEVIVTVRDDGPGRSSETRGGYGIAGMRERVQLLGGSFTADDNSADNGFVVRAVLPRADESG